MTKRQAKDLQKLMDELANYATTEQAAKLLGVSERQARKLADEKRVKGFKIGADWRIDKESIEEYLENKSPRGRKPKAN